MNQDHITTTIEALRIALRQLKRPTNGHLERRLAHLKDAMRAINTAADEIVLAYTETMIHLRNALDDAHREAGARAQAQHSTSPTA